MTILRLQIDIDSDVHPELHAMLAPMGNSLPQTERLRQLAAAGLIWEHLRTHVHPSAAVVMVPVATGSGAGDADPATQTAASPLRPSNMPALSTELVGSREMALSELPVLNDAIEGDELRRPKRAAQKQTASAPSTGRRPDVVAGTSDRDGVSPPVRKAGTRSRLLRMKEKGLFSNGPDH